MFKGKTYTTSEVAEMVGVSRQTLYSWIAAGKVRVPKSIPMGREVVRFWRDADVEKIKKWREQSKKK